MKHEALREAVCEANRAIGRSGLAMLSWGNASGVDRDAGVMAIKPSGIACGDLQPEDLVIVEIETGETRDNGLRPSSDTPTHLHLYSEFESVGGLVHSHSHYATVWAQARREIPCLGTTHADTFYGTLPLTRMLNEAEVREAYELNTGAVIVERFRKDKLDPLAVPGVLVAGHGPFAWGSGPLQALHNAVALEEVAKMALHALALEPGSDPIPRYLLDKHYLRKHGKGAYYGQEQS